MQTDTNVSGIQELLRTTSEITALESKILQCVENKNKHSQKIAQHCQAVVDGKFASSLLEQLEQLEKQEAELETEHIDLLKSLFEKTRNQRSKVLAEQQDKLVANTKEPNNVKNLLSGSASNVFKSSFTSDLSAVVFGKSTRASLAKRGNNPFLDESEQQGHEDKDVLQNTTLWELKKEEIEISNDKLGKGSFGQVFKGKLRGMPVAVKIITPNWSSEEEAAIIIDDFRNECAVMSKLKHPNCLLFMGVCIEENGENTKLIMVTELMPRGSVYHLIHPEDPKKKIVFKQRMKFAKDAALALNCLHLSNPPIVHLDFKTQNLLVDKNWVAKVADFGLSRVHQPNKNKGAAGSPVYMAPEVLSDKTYDQKADVYSFGIVLWELLTQQKPFEDQDFKSVDEIYEYIVIDNKRPAIPSSTPPELGALIRSCWQEDPAKRPSFKDILESHVLDNVIVDAIISNANLLGRQFWKQNFTSAEETHEVVGWKKFARSLVQFCKLEFAKGSILDDQLEIKIMKVLFADNRENLVTIESFSRILEWFGPFTEDKTFVDNLMAIAALPGFYGDISSAEAEQIMAGKKPGNYVIRFSSQQPGFYTITTVSEENVLKHYRIKHKPGLGFVLGNEEFSSLKQLIKKHRKDLCLKRAVKESKIAGIIMTHTGDVSSAYVEIEMED